MNLSEKTLNSEKVLSNKRKCRLRFFADRTTPCIWEIFKRCSRRNVLGRIPFIRIIIPSTRITSPYSFFFSCAGYYPFHIFGHHSRVDNVTIPRFETIFIVVISLSIFPSRKRRENRVILFLARSLKISSHQEFQRFPWETNHASGRPISWIRYS